MIKLILLSLFLLMADTPRQVLLFYNKEDSEIWTKQMAELNSQQAGIKDRDIIIKSYKLSSENEAVWKKWNIDKSKPFTFILIGRDGGEKHRSNQIVSHRELFSKIDAMPMRKNEIRK